MHVSVNVNIDDAIKKLEVFRRDQLPHALSQALNKTAEDAIKDIQNEMRRAFDSPTEWTINSLYVKYGNKRNPGASVNAKNTSSKGPAPVNWLLPETVGGNRKHKRMERALQHLGMLPPGMMLYPTKFADIDANGNVSSGQVIQILSYLKAFGTKDFGPINKPKQKKREAKIGHAYFVGKPKGKIAGIWKRLNFASGSAVVPLFYFIPSPTYRPRLDFYGVAKKSFASRFQDNLSKSMLEAIKSAR